MRVVISVIKQGHIKYTSTPRKAERGVLCVLLCTRVEILTGEILHNPRVYQPEKCVFLLPAHSLLIPALKSKLGTINVQKNELFACYSAERMSAC